jgi:hypothetical protein
MVRTPGDANDAVRMGATVTVVDIVMKDESWRKGEGEGLGRTTWPVEKSDVRKGGPG